MTQIMIADDHPIVVSGLEMLLRKSGYDIAASVADGNAALEGVAGADPDILILDVQMPGRNGLEVLRALRAEGDERPVVLLTAAIDGRQIAEALGLRVQGLVLKDSPPDTLLRCLEEVRAGGRWIDPAMEERGLAAGSGGGMHQLSARERAVVDHVVQGLRNRDIANLLGIAEGTVKVHLHKVYEKLGVGSRTELVIYARDLAQR
jgi:two-component system nitrate/nitrite response regulator NarP